MASGTNPPSPIQLLNAVMKGDGPTILRLAREGAVVDFDTTPYVSEVLFTQVLQEWTAKDVRGTPLHLAVRAGKDAAVAALLRCGANINSTTDEGETPLIMACEKGHNTLISLLLDKGADVCAITTSGITALYASCKNIKCTYDSINALVEAGAEIDVPGHAPLIAAALGGDADVVELLLSVDADTEVQNTEGKTAFRVACEAKPAKDTSHDEVGFRLLDAGATHDFPGFSALHCAAEHGLRKVAETLIELGVYVDMVFGTKGETALHMACKHSQRAVAELLLDKGASPVLMTTDGRTPLWLACKAKSAELVELLLLKGASANATPGTKFVPLVTAAEIGAEAVVRRLLAAGAEVDIVDDLGRTAFYVALFHSYGNVAELLLEKGASFTLVPPEPLFHTAPLYRVAECGFDRLLEALVHKGADFTVALPCGCMPIHLACKRGRSSTVALLLEHTYRENPDLPMPTFWSTVEIATRGGYSDIVSLLVNLQPRIANMTTTCDVEDIGEGVNKIRFVHLQIKNGGVINTWEARMDQPLSAVFSGYCLAKNLSSTGHEFLFRGRTVDLVNETPASMGLTNDSMLDLHPIQKDKAADAVHCMHFGEAGSAELVRSFYVYNSFDDIMWYLCKGRHSVLSPLIRRLQLENGVALPTHQTPYMLKIPNHTFYRIVIADDATVDLWELALINCHSALAVELKARCQNNFRDLRSLGSSIRLACSMGLVRLSTSVLEASKGVYPKREIQLAVSIPDEVTGDTALHLAVRGDYSDCVKWLIASGADCTAKNKAGETPYDVLKNKTSVCGWILSRELERIAERNYEELISMPSEPKKKKKKNKKKKGAKAAASGEPSAESDDAAPPAEAAVAAAAPTASESEPKQNGKAPKKKQAASESKAAPAPAHATKGAAVPHANGPAPAATPPPGSTAAPTEPAAPTAKRMTKREKRAANAAAAAAAAANVNATDDASPAAVNQDDSAAPTSTSSAAPAPAPSAKTAPPANAKATAAKGANAKKPPAPAPAPPIDVSVTATTTTTTTTSTATGSTTTVNSSGVAANKKKKGQQRATAAAHDAQKEAEEKEEDLSVLPASVPPANSSPASPPPTDGPPRWTCSRCTLENDPAREVCDACEAPRSRTSSPPTLPAPVTRPAPAPTQPSRTMPPPPQPRAAPKVPAASAPLRLGIPGAPPPPPQKAPRAKAAAPAAKAPPGAPPPTAKAGTAKAPAPGPKPKAPPPSPIKTVLGATRVTPAPVAAPAPAPALLATPAGPRQLLMKPHAASGPPASNGAGGAGEVWVRPIPIAIAATSKTAAPAAAMPNGPVDPIAAPSRRAEEPSPTRDLDMHTPSSSVPSASEFPPLSDRSTPPSVPSTPPRRASPVPVGGKGPSTPQPPSPHKAGTPSLVPSSPAARARGEQQAPHRGSPVGAGALAAPPPGRGAPRSPAGANGDGSEGVAPAPTGGRRARGGAGARRRLDAEREGGQAPVAHGRGGAAAGAGNGAHPRGPQQPQLPPPQPPHGVHAGHAGMPPPMPPYAGPRADAYGAGVVPPGVRGYHPDAGAYDMAAAAGGFDAAYRAAIWQQQANGPAPASAARAWEDAPMYMPGQPRGPSPNGVSLWGGAHAPGGPAHDAGPGQVGYPPAAWGEAAASQWPAAHGVYPQGMMPDMTNAAGWGAQQWGAGGAAMGVPQQADALSRGYNFSHLWDTGLAAAGAMAAASLGAGAPGDHPSVAASVAAAGGPVESPNKPRAAFDERVSAPGAPISTGGAGFIGDRRPKTAAPAPTPTAPPTAASRRFDAFNFDDASGAGVEHPEEDGIPPAMWHRGSATSRFVFERGPDGAHGGEAGMEDDAKVEEFDGFSFPVGTLPRTTGPIGHGEWAAG